MARCERYDFALDRLRVARRFAEAEEQARRAAQASVEGNRAELARLMPAGDFLLFAGLTLPLDDLVGLVGSEAEGVLLEGLGNTSPEVHSETKSSGPVVGQGVGRNHTPRHFKEA